MSRPKKNTNYLHSIDSLGKALNEISKEHKLIKSNIFRFASLFYDNCISGGLYNASTGSNVRNVVYIDSDGSEQIGGFGYKTLDKWTDYLTTLLKRLSYINKLKDNNTLFGDMNDINIILDMRKSTGTFRKSIKALMSIMSDCTQEISMYIDITELIFNSGSKVAPSSDSNFTKTSDGNTIWTVQEVYDVMAHFNITQEKLTYSEIIKNLIEIGFLSVLKEKYITTATALKAERVIQNHILKSSNLKIEAGKSCFELSTSQQEWGERTFNSNRMLQTGTGYAGTGKTVTTSAYINGAITAGLSVATMAPTGVASLVLQESLEKNGVDTTKMFGGRVRTIDSLIWTPTKKDDVDPDLIVIDECSMVSSEKLAEVIMRWSDAKLVCLGDPSQLPPIESGYPFRDIIRLTDPIPMTEVRRTDDKVLKKAFEKIRQGNLDLSVFLKIIPFGGKSKVQNKISTGILKMLIDYVYECISYGLNEKGFANCLMMAKTNRLVDAINNLSLSLKLYGNIKDKAQLVKAEEVVRAYYNITSESSNYLTRSNVFAVGTPVVWSDNRLDLPATEGKDMVYNGFPGIVVKKNLIEILATNSKTGECKKVHIKADEYADSLKPSFCVTVNKAQGGTYRDAVLFMRQTWLKQENSKFTSFWEGTRLYTALTRASRNAVLVSFDNYVSSKVDMDTDYRDTILAKFGRGQ